MAMGEAPGSAPKNVAGDRPVPLRRSELQIRMAATHEKKPLRASTSALSIRTLAQTEPAQCAPWGGSWLGSTGTKTNNGSDDAHLVAGDETFVLKQDQDFTVVRARLTYHFNSGY